MRKLNNFALLGLDFPSETKVKLPFTPTKF